jgi:hypothetical protein
MRRRLKLPSRFASAEVGRQPPAVLQLSSHQGLAICPAVLFGASDVQFQAQRDLSNVFGGRYAPSEQPGDLAAECALAERIYNPGKAERQFECPRHAAWSWRLLGCIEAGCVAWFIISANLRTLQPLRPHRAHQLDECCR